MRLEGLDAAQALGITREEGHDDGARISEPAQPFPLADTYDRLRNEAPQAGEPARGARKAAKRTANDWIGVQATGVGRAIERPSEPDAASWAALSAIARRAPSHRTLAIAIARDLAIELAVMDPRTRTAVRERLCADLELALGEDAARLDLAACARDRSLPVELRLAAHLHLSKAERDRLRAIVGACHSHAAIREWRDFVFACVALARPGALQALSAFEPGKKEERPNEVHLVSRAFRQGILTAEELDRVLSSPSGAAPTKQGSVREKLDRLGISTAQATEVGLAEAAGWIAAIERLLPHIEAMAGSDLFRKDGGEKMFPKCAAALVSTVQKVIEGKWPEARYTGPIAERLMSGLSDAQRAAWRRPLRESYDVGAVDPAVWGPFAAELRQIARLVRREAPSAGVEVERGRLEALEKKSRDLAAAAATAAKDEIETRRLNREIGPLKNDLNLLRLVFSPKRVPANADEANALHALASSGLGAARRHHLEVTAQRLAPLVEAMCAQKDDGVAKVEVTDTDAPAGFLNVYRGDSCLLPGHGSSSGLVGYMANANIRQLMAHREGKLIARSLMFIRHIETEGYQGKALFFDFPLSPNRSEAPLEGTIALFKAGIQKAKRVGVPFVVKGDYVKHCVIDPRLKALLAGGGQCEATMTIDPGHAPVIYGQGLLLQCVGEEPFVYEDPLFVVKPDAIAAS
jgi:hypothetical protein